MNEMQRVEGLLRAFSGEPSWASLIGVYCRKGRDATAVGYSPLEHYRCEFELCRCPCHGAR